MATLALAGAVIAVTAASTSEILCRQRPHQTTPALLALTAPPPPVDAAASATCEAWPPTRRSIDATSARPEGWYWYSPTRRPDLAQLATAVSDDLDFLDSQIAAADPAPVVTAARAYITVQRTELTAIATRTLTNALAGSVSSARAELNHACGLAH